VYRKKIVQTVEERGCRTEGDRQEGGDKKCIIINLNCVTLLP